MVAGRQERRRIKIGTVEFEEGKRGKGRRTGGGEGGGVRKR